ncbi:MAG: hypothetical protein R3F46_11315 [bacterium]
MISSTIFCAPSPHAVHEYQRLVAAFEDLLGQFLTRTRQPDHDRHLALQLVIDIHDALGHQVRTGDAAEDIDEDALHVRVAQHGDQCLLHTLGRGTAAEVEEVVGRAARALDDVHRGHHEARAIAADADIAAGQVHIGQAFLHRLDLILIQLGAGLTQPGDLLLAVKRIVIEVHLGIDRHDLTLLGDHQRVDLRHLGIGGHEAVVELVDEARDRAGLRRVHAAHVDGLADLVILDADGRVDVDLGDLLGSAGCHFLDVHTTGGAEDQHNALVLAVEREAEVVLGFDVHGIRDEHTVHGQALDLHSEDLRGDLKGLLGILGELHASGLAAATGMHLGLDDHHAADLLGDGPDFLRRACQLPMVCGDAELAHDFACLILVDLHYRSCLGVLPGKL